MEEINHKRNERRADDSESGKGARRMSGAYTQARKALRRSGGVHACLHIIMSSG